MRRWGTGGDLAREGPVAEGGEGEVEGGGGDGGGLEELRHGEGIRGAARLKGATSQRGHAMGWGWDGTWG